MTDTNAFANGGSMVFLAMTFGFIGVIFSENITKDKISGIKNQLLISSLDRRIYWLSNFTIHTLSCFIPFICSIIVMACFQFESILNNNFFSFIFIILLYSPLIVLFSYVLVIPMNNLQFVQEWLGELLGIFALVPWAFTAFSDNPSDLIMNLCSILPPYGIFRAFCIFINIYY